MADFNNLFGDDRDIVQETGASIGQKLRVASNGTELEGFELFAESAPSAPSGGVQFTLGNGTGTPPSGEINIISGGSSVVGTAFPGSGTDNWTIIFANTTEHDSVETNNSGTDYIMIYVDADNYAIGLGAVIPAPTNTTQINFDEEATYSVSVGSLSASGSTVTLYNLGALTEAYVFPSTTTVTGDLTVTGTVDGVLIGSIRNINPVAGTGGIAQNFQIWAGTQTEFDNQFDNDGSGTVSGTPAETDGSVVYIITNN